MLSTTRIESVTTHLAMYSATDPENRLEVNYSLMGADASLFQLSGTQVLSFKEKLPDYENADRTRTGTTCTR